MNTRQLNLFCAALCGVIVILIFLLAGKSSAPVRPDKHVIDSLSRERNLIMASLLNANRKISIIQRTGNAWRDTVSLLKAQLVRLKKEPKKPVLLSNAQVDSVFAARYSSFQKKVDLMPIPLETGIDIVGDLEAKDQGDKIINKQAEIIVADSLELINCRQENAARIKKDSLEKLDDQNLISQTSEQKKENDELSKENKKLSNKNKFLRIVTDVTLGVIAFLAVALALK